MQAYNKDLLENTVLVSEARALEEVDFISKEQLQLIEDELPSYPQTLALVKIALFVLGIFLFSSCSSLLALFTMTGGSSNFGITFSVYTLFGFAGLEFIIRKWKYFGNGMDNAFLYCAELSLILTFGFFIEGWDHLSPAFFFAGLVGAACCYRYVDQFSAFIACFGLTAFIACSFFNFGNSMSAFLPFVMMFLAIGLYFIYSKLKENASEIYSKALNVCYVFALFLFYLSSNYFIVRESSIELLDMDLLPGEDISLAFLFWALTILVPLCYIYFGLQKRDRILLWVGLLCSIVSVITVRHYYSLMPTELALMLAGIVLFGIAFFVLRRLKGKTSGPTSERDRFLNSGALDNAEVLMRLQRYAVKPHVTDPSTDVEFGGGEFGGGGSGNKF